MADQQTTDAVIEGGKAVGSGGGLLALAWMAFNRFAKKADDNDEREAKALEAVLAKLETINASLSALTTKVDVLSERMSGVLLRVDKNETKLEEAIERLSKLEGAFEHLQEQLAK